MDSRTAATKADLTSAMADTAQASVTAINSRASSGRRTLPLRQRVPAYDLRRHGDSAEAPHGRGEGFGAKQTWHHQQQRLQQQLRQQQQQQQEQQEQQQQQKQNQNQDGNTMRGSTGGRATAIKKSGNKITATRNQAVQRLPPCIEEEGVAGRGGDEAVIATAAAAAARGLLRGETSGQEEPGRVVTSREEMVACQRDSEAETETEKTTERKSDARNSAKAQGRGKGNKPQQPALSSDKPSSLSRGSKEGIMGTGAENEGGKGRGKAWLPPPPVVPRPQATHNAAMLAFLGDSIFEVSDWGGKD